jgi:hypothetical protein
VHHRRPNIVYTNTVHSRAIFSFLIFFPPLSLFDYGQHLSKITILFTKPKEIKNLCLAWFMEQESSGRQRYSLFLSHLEQPYYCSLRTMSSPNIKVIFLNTIFLTHQGFSLQSSQTRILLIHLARIRPFQRFFSLVFEIVPVLKRRTVSKWHSNQPWQWSPPYSSALWPMHT